MTTSQDGIALGSLGLLSLFAIACGSAESQRPSSDTPPAASAGVCPMHAEAGGACPCPMHAETGAACPCPLQAEGVRVTEEDVEGGAALVLTAAEGGDVEAVRQHAERIAAMHAARRGRGAPPGGAGRGMARHPNMHAAEARAEPTDDGARIVFTPQEGGDVEALREEVRAHAEAMGSGRCPMMQ